MPNAPLSAGASPAELLFHSKAEINMFKLKRKMPRAKVYIALFVLEILLAAVQLKSSVLLQQTDKRDGEGRQSRGPGGHSC